MTEPVKCAVKHTKYQPKDEEWKCPKCEATANQPDGFFNDESENNDCPLLHDGDVLVCYRCKFSSSGRGYAFRLQKAARMVPCPTCEGRGLVKGGG